MPAYGTVAQLREYLTQVPTGSVADALLQSCLDRATDTVDGAMGFAWTAYREAAAKDVRAEANSEYLTLPAHQVGGVTAVAWLTGKGTIYACTEAMTDYEELEDGRLWRSEGWMRREWYRVTAPWGNGPVPASLVEVCLELAINIWGSRDSKQISDVVGVEGAVGYNRALTNRQRMIIEDCRRRAGEWGFA